MQNNHIKKIISLFFGKHLSKAKIVLFGRWHSALSDTEEKDKCLREIWDNSPSNVTLSTYSDWEEIKAAISATNKVRPILQFKWLKYAIAACFFMIAIPSILYFKDIGNRTISMSEVFVPYGESREIILPDSSKAWISAGTLLIYPESFEKLDSRTIYLTGEAVFNVTKNKEKPFIVKTAYMDVQALGTTFTVKAYSADRFTSATLEEGSIRVDVKTDISTPSILKPGDQLTFSHIDQSINISAIDISSFEKIKDGYLIFENVSIHELIKALERSYNLTVHYNTHKYENNCYNVKFGPNESIEDVFRVLKQLIGIDYKIEGNTIFIN